MSRVPSGTTPRAGYTALLRTTVTALIFTCSTSQKTTGYMGSSGQVCEDESAAIPASMTELMNSGLTWVSYCQAGKPWILRTREAVRARCARSWRCARCGGCHW